MLSQGLGLGMVSRLAVALHCTALNKLRVAFVQCELSLLGPYVKRCGNTCLEFHEATPSKAIHVCTRDIIEAAFGGFEQSARWIK